MIRTSKILCCLALVTLFAKPPAIDFRAIAAAVLVTLQEEPAPPDGKCLDCNGTGKVGDGTVMAPCQSCDGTGRNVRKELPAFSPYSAARDEHLQTGKPLLIMITSNRCAICKSNLQKVIQPLQQNGALQNVAFCVLNETLQPELCQRVRAAAHAEQRRLTPTYIAFHRRDDDTKEARHHTGSVTPQRLLQLIE